MKKQTKLTKNELLTGAYYSADFRCAQIDEIFKYIDDDGYILGENLNDIQSSFVLSEIDKYTESFNKLSAKNKKISNKKFYEIFDNIIDLFYKEFNVKNYKKPKITIVEKFPHPFEDRNYKAMTFNKTHEQQFNVPEGIYLLKKYTIHGISEIMIAHEIMHYIESYMTPINEQLKQCPFLVEGIVDFMSLYLLQKYNIIDGICIKNWLSFGRGNCSKDYIGSLYFKQAKQILLIAKTCGIEEVKRLIMGGDRLLSNIDLSKYCDKDYKIAKDKTLQKIVSYYDLIYTNFVLTAEELYVFESTLGLVDGEEIKKLDLNINKQKSKKILESLQKYGLVYILDDMVYNTNKTTLKTIKVSLF